MSYHIHYKQKCTNIKDVTAHRHLKFIIILILSIIILLTVGKEQITSWLIPGDDTVTKEAFYVFQDQLQSGESLRCALETFYKEILKRAQ